MLPLFLCRSGDDDSLMIRLFFVECVCVLFFMFCSCSLSFDCFVVDAFLVRRDC